MSLLRSGAYTLMASVAQIVLGMVGVAIIARTLGPAGKGGYDIYWTTANTAVMVFAFALPSGITYTVARTRVDLPRLIHHLLIVSLAVGGLTFAALRLLTLAPKLRALLPADVVILATTALTAAGLAAVNLFRAVIVGQRRFRSASLADIARACLVVAAIGVGAAATVHMGGSRLHWIVWGNSGGILLSSIIYFYRLGFFGTRSSIRRPFLSPEIQSALAYAAPTYIANLVQYLNYRVDVYFVSGLSGLAAVGTYQLAVIIAETLRILPIATQAVIWPTIASQQGDTRRNAQLTLRSARAVFFVTLMGALLLGAAGEFVIPSVFGSLYSPSVPALLFLLPGLALFSITTVLAGYIAGMGMPQLNLKASAFGLVATIVLDVLLIPRYSIIGAASASSVSYLVTTLYTMLIFGRLTGVRGHEVFVPTRADFLMIRRAVVQLSSRARE